MNDERFDAWSRRLTENGSRRHVMRLMAGGALGIALARRALPATAHHPDPCNCVHYVRWRTGLSGGPATAGRLHREGDEQQGVRQGQPTGRSDHGLRQERQMREFLLRPYGTRPKCNLQLYDEKVGDLRRRRELGQLRHSPESFRGNVRRLGQSLGREFLRQAVGSALPA